MEQLKDQAKRLGVEESVFFEINKDINEVHAIFKQAKAAIHTMKFEHFGIAICEMMAAGIITIAHNSAGPKTDIIGACDQMIGCLASTEEDYVRYVVMAMNNF